MVSADWVRPRLVVLLVSLWALPSSVGAEEGPETPSSSASMAPPKAEKEKDGGVYFSLTGGPSFGIGSTHAWAEVCPSAPAIGFTPGCATTAPVGFVADARLGMNFGGFAIEGFALGAGDWTSASLEGIDGLGLPSYATNMQIGRIGGGFGGGVRLVGKKGFVRLHFGGGGGVLFRHVYTNVTSLDGSSTGYAAPLVRADVGIVLAGFLSIGVLGFVEFADAVAITPNLDELGPAGDVFEQALGSTVVFEGPQYFIGPVIGFQFGG